MSATPLPPPGRYIDPLVDYAFKKIFGSEPNKDLLIDFLNAVFRGRKMITDLSYNPTEYSGEDGVTGNVIFDLHCTGSDGEEFIIEVQRQSQLFFKERALYYTSRLISNQSPKGETHRWKYNLTEVYLVALLEKTKLEGSPVNEYIHDVSLCYNANGKTFYDKLGYTYIELSKFRKNEPELQTDLDKWLYILKHLSKMNKLPGYLRKPIFEKLFRIAEYAKLSKEERAMYDDKRMYQWDNDNALEYARKEAWQEGKMEGRQEGKTEGEAERSFVIASTMKNLGYCVTEIIKITGLTTEQVEAL